MKSTRIRLNYFPFIMFSIFIGIFPFITQNKYYLSVGTFLGINTLLILGLVMIMGFGGLPSLGHGAFYGFGAYVTSILNTKLELSPLIGLVGALLLTGIVALIIAIPTVKLKGHYLALVTLGLSFIFYTLGVECELLTGGIDGITRIQRFPFVTTDRGYFLIIWLVTLFFLLLSFHIVNSRMGRALNATREEEIAATVSGINVQSYKVQAFVLGCVYAGIAGWQYAHYVTFISPHCFTPHLSVVLVAVGMLGGVRNIGGALVGALVMTLIPEFLRAFGDFEILIFGIMIVLVAMYMPEGITKFIIQGLGKFIKFKKPYRA
ncbi:MAG: branched-chain amino acid ABC transporter permease [Thermodesulfobacteriota bacterium]|jgi:branched-chain amino acid transport system permease protein